MPRAREIGDARERPFWWVENSAVDDLWIPFVGAHAWAVYCVLVRHADGQGRSMPSLSTLSDLTGVSPAQVKRSLKVLFGSGLIRKVRAGGPTGTTVYQVRNLPQSKNAVAPSPQPAPPVQTVQQKQRSVTDATLDFLAEEPEVVAPPAPLDKGRASRRCPPDWEPSEQHREIAAEEGVDFDRELAKMRDHEFANPRKDWDATFRNWLRSSRGKSPEYRETNKKHQAAKEVMDFYAQEQVV
jgi:hypothetical protein